MCKAFFLGVAYLSSACAQMYDFPGTGVEVIIDDNCNSFAQVAKDFLASRGLRVFRGFTNLEEDWTCGAGYRCIGFRNAPPRTAEGKRLSRREIVEHYLAGPIDLRPKKLGHGYWEAPDRNFVMGAALQLKYDEPGSCGVKFFVGFGLGGMEFLGPLPFDLRTWPVPPDNGQLQKEYLAAILQALRNRR